MKSITRSLSAQFVFTCFTLLLSWAHLSFNAAAGICFKSNVFSATTLHYSRWQPFPRLPEMRSTWISDNRVFSCALVSASGQQKPLYNPATDSMQLEIETTWNLLLTFGEVGFSPEDDQLLYSLFIHLGWCFPSSLYQSSTFKQLKIHANSFLHLDNNA